MARGPPIDGRAPAAAHCVLGNVGPHVQVAQLVHEIGGIIYLVGAERHCDGSVGASFDHGQRGHALGMAVGLRLTGVHEQAGAVLHQGVGPLRLDGSARTDGFAPASYAISGDTTAHEGQVRGNRAAGNRPNEVSGGL